MTTDGTIVEAAPAKINLTLHVTGQRDDGYHLLDSLVMFTQMGDLITVAPADDLTLAIDGPYAKGLSAEDDNLVLRAARSFGAGRGSAITLTKNLPVASGIGGGSADAAATLRALSRLWDLPVPDLSAQLALGADVPVCMSHDLTRMQGIGNDITRLGTTPQLSMLLVNPNIGVSTPAVFNGLASKVNAAMDDPMPDPANASNWIEWLKLQRNDLERPAKTIAPEVASVLTVLAQSDECALARMSGSGATCFAIFNDNAACAAARASLKQQHPNWWIVQTSPAT